MNEVANAVAAAVQEQGAATQEITRSTLYAPQGSKHVSENISGVRTPQPPTTSRLLPRCWRPRVSSSGAR